MRKRTIGVVSAVLLVLFIIGIGSALAKYTGEQGEQAGIHSTPFYFTSDYLSESAPPEHKIYGDSVAFEVRNYIDSLRINAENIAYTVSATEGGTLSSGSGTLTGGSMARDTITLTYSGEEAEKEITVTVESSSPYVKVLQAKFIFAKPVLRYEIIDKANSYHAELYIHTGNEQAEVTVKWNKDFLWIDETNDYVIKGDLHENKNSATVTVPPHTTAKIVFFKNDITQNYSRVVTEFADMINMPTASGS